MIAEIFIYKSNYISFSLTLTLYIDLNFNSARIWLSVGISVIDDCTFISLKLIQYVPIISISRILNNNLMFSCAYINRFYASKCILLCNACPIIRDIWYLRAIYFRQQLFMGTHKPYPI